MSDAISKRKDLQKAFDALDLWRQHEKDKPTGRWYEPLGMRPPEDACVYRCSKCKQRAPRKWENLRQELTPFCPYCGFKMENGDEGKYILADVEEEMNERSYKQTESYTYIV